MLTTEELHRARALFPHTRQGMIYLNHAGTGPLSSRVVEAILGHLEERSTGSVETYWQDMAMVNRCRDQVRALINAESSDRIAFFVNTSEPLNVVAAGLGLRDGDRVLLNDSEFPANVYPYINLRRHGVAIDTLQCHEGPIAPAMIEQALTPRTRVVALSAVQFLSGYRADLAAIGALCRERGIAFVVDGIQAVGAVQVDVQKMCIDALAAGAQKWQLSPHGTGFLYVTEELQARINQPSLGWLGVENPWDFRNYTQPLAPSARRYEGGTLNLPGLWGLEASLSTLLEFTPASIEEQILSLTGLLREELQRIPGVRIITDFPDQARAGIMTIELPGGCDCPAVFKAMMARNVIIALREGKLRYSPHFYNTPEEMRTAANITRECLDATTKKPT